MGRRIEQFDKNYVGLAWNFQVNPDSCGNAAHYENYLRFSAITDRNDGNGLTYIIITDENGPEQICGFISLRASSVIKQYSDHTIGEAALEITELAVDKRYEHHGIGKLMLALAVSVASSINSEYASVKYIALCADSMAVPFYEHFGFEKMVEYGDVPRDGWNNDCIPMTLRLPNG